MTSARGRGGRDLKSSVWDHFGWVVEVGGGVRAFNIGCWRHFWMAPYGYHSVINDFIRFGNSFFSQTAMCWGTTCWTSRKTPHPSRMSSSDCPPPRRSSSPPLGCQSSWHWASSHCKRTQWEDFFVNFQSFFLSAPLWTFWFGFSF